MFKKSLATAALAVIAVFALAPAAGAADYTVPTNLSSASDSTPAAGSATTVSFAASAFDNNEQVDFVANGSGAATLSIVKAVASNTVTKTATSTGAASAVITLPSNATGVYTVTATGATSGNVGTVALTVVAVDGGLASTGYDAPVLVIWGAAGLLILGAALVAVRISVRRQHAAA
jgi:hypothetical protein